MQQLMTTIGLEPWAAWLTAAVVLLLAEMFTPGFALACFSIGCLPAALAAALGGSWQWQLAAFAAASLVSFATIRPVVMRHFYARSQTVPTNVAAMAGKKGVVVAAFDPVTPSTTPRPSARS